LESSAHQAPELQQTDVANMYVEWSLKLFLASV